MRAAAPLDVVRRYNRAYDARDVEDMLALVDEESELVTRHRGVMRGHEPFRAFMARQTYGVTPVVKERRYFAERDRIVVGGIIEWRYVESGELAGRDEGATVCLVRDGRIARLELHEDLPSALTAAGLTEADEVDDH